MQPVPRFAWVEKPHDDEMRKSLWNVPGGVHGISGSRARFPVV